ncbi:GIY-YIG nuclease family protein [Streptomyces xanthophaeus]
MGKGKPFIPQHDRRLTQAVWNRYLKYIEPNDPAKLMILGVFREYEVGDIAVNDETAAMAVKLGRVRHQRNLEERAERASREAQGRREAETFRKLLDDNPDGIVYYVRRGNLLKIGTTAKYDARMRALRPDEVLAVEPGSYALEHQRHNEFDASRWSRGSEYFHISDELRAHVVELRQQHGIPDQAVITVTDGRRILDDPN